MKYSFLKLNLIVLPLLFLVSCMDCVEPQGNIAQKNIEIKGFTKLKIDIPGKVILKQGDSPVATLTTYENYLDLIEFKRKGKWLIIKSKQCLSSVDANELKVELIFGFLDEVVCNGSAEVKSISQIKEKNLSIKLNGSGNFLSEVFSDKINAGINGSGNIILNGSVNTLNAEINGSGNINAAALKTLNAEVNLKGSGNARIFVKDKLDVNILGSGSVKYLGTPDIRSNIKGSGEVIKINR